MTTFNPTHRLVREAARLSQETGKQISFVESEKGEYTVKLDGQEIGVVMGGGTAIQSLLTCTYEEWEEAVVPVQGVRYKDGYFDHAGGRMSVRAYLQMRGIERTERQIAIITKQVCIKAIKSEELNEDQLWEEYENGTMYPDYLNPFDECSVWG